MRFMQLKHDPNAVVKKKLIKSGKKWVVVSTLSFAGLLLGGAVTGLNVHADVVGISGATSTDMTPPSITNSGNDQAQSLTSDLTISSNLGDVIVNNVTGEVGQTVTIAVPVKAGYKADKSMVVANVNANGTITTDETIHYTSTEPTNVQNVETSTANTFSGEDTSTTSTDVPAPANEVVTPQSRALSVPESDTPTDNIDDGGKFGDSSWHIDNGGVLHIGAGELGSTSDPYWGGANAHKSDIKSIQIDDGVIANPDSGNLFSTLSNVTKIDGLDNLDTSNVTNMHYMFAGMSSLQDLDLSSFDTSNVTDMSGMFTRSSTFKELDLSSFDTAKVKNMSYMFAGSSPYISTNANNMNMESILINPDKFNTSSVTTMSEMFYGLSKLKGVNLSKFDTSNVNDVSRMFCNDISLMSLDLSNFDTSSLAGKNDPINSMLYGTNLYKIKLGENTGLSTLVELNDGNWQAVGTGTENSPQGQKMSAAQIETLYSTMPAVAETYVRTVSGTLSVPTSYSDKSDKGSISAGIISGVPGNEFNTVITVPAVDGYTPYKNGTDKLVKNDDGSYTATISGTIDEKDVTPTDNIVYKPDDVSISIIAKVLNESGNCMDIYTIPDISGEVSNYDVSSLLPVISGYSPTKTTVDIAKNEDGDLVATDILYSENPVSGNVTIPSNYKDLVVVKNVSGKKNRTITVGVPSYPGYTADKKTVQVSIDNDGKFSVVDPDNAGYVTYTKNPTSNGGGGSTTTTPTSTITDVNIDVATFADQPAARLYDSNGNLITNRALQPNTGWFADKKLSKNGISYYRVATDEWVKMDDVYVYTPNNKYVETYNDSSKDVFNAHQKQVSRQLRPDSDWITDVYTYMNGTKYYRISSNEFVSANDAFEYAPIHAIVQTNGYNTTVYDEYGNAVTNRQLAAKSNWKTDKTATINGQTMYRVATNEWIKATDVLSFKEY